MISLSRGWITRLAGGAQLQLLLTTFVALLVMRLVGQLAGTIHDPSLPLPGTALALMGFVGATAIGASAWARFDTEAVLWRYYWNHRVEWRDITKVALVTKAVGLGGARFSLEIWTGTHRRRVTPAAGNGAKQRAFGRALLAEAAARGIATEDDWIS
jgi:hypothetical protein